MAEKLCELAQTSGRESAVLAEDRVVRLESTSVQAQTAARRRLLPAFVAEPEPTLHCVLASQASRILEFTVCLAPAVCDGLLWPPCYYEVMPQLVMTIPADASPTY